MVLSRSLSTAHRTRKGSTRQTYRFCLFCKDLKPQVMRVRSLWVAMSQRVFVGQRLVRTVEDITDDGRIQLGQGI